MAELNAGKVVKKVRQRLEISQEGLSRLLNATKGAVQHWERGRNNPDLARLLALRELCPAGAERKELDALIRQVQAEVAPLPTGKQRAAAREGAPGRASDLFPPGGLTLLRREKARLERQLKKLEGTAQRQAEQNRILEDLASQLQREVAALKGKQAAKASATSHGAAV